MKSLLEKAYDPTTVEAKWYRFWESNGLFAADENNKTDRNYAIVIPPPNVTGMLHMGHSLNITLQDILCRYRRLCGDNVLWMPGTDHAGIATQNVVERHLAAKGIDRHQLGREKFIEAVWEWREQYGSAIIRQLKRLGASCDWARERFTMDDGLSRAVRKVFVQLYEEGLIHKDNYIINWCPRCMTALADLEVEHEEMPGHLYHIQYPRSDGGTGPVVATTRPETMLGDTAVAVHPDDARYADLVGHAVDLPLTGRTIPVLADPYVDMTFGTGALKVTPAHDPNDFEIGRRHNLPSVKVIGDDGKMTEAAGAYAGMDRFACRNAVVADLKEKGLLESTEPHQHGIGHCYRCRTVVEPNLSKQWFVKTGPLARKAVEDVAAGRTRIVPEKWTTDYYKWMENIRDWCISRQIWWGHPIPAWTCGDCGKIIVAMESPDACPDCGHAELIPDPDVLDTWFSSALWPFSTLGWPDETPLLKRFYPTSVLVTGFDILFFWVARMMMMGHHFMKDVPFRDVYVHALVRDESGKKMSKSSGNVIDPLTIIETHGTDALRFTLAAFAAQGRDIKLSEKRIEGYRHFINKLWNAARFSLMHLRESDHQPSAAESIFLPDRWILSRLKTVSREAADAIDAYRFNDAANSLYHFVWHEFCDWYLELIKPTLYHDDVSADQKKITTGVLERVLGEILIMLHPFIPFVTEEIWHYLPGTSASIMTAAYPGSDTTATELTKDPEAEQGMAVLTGIITAIRNIRGEMNIPPSQTLSVVVQTDLQQRRDLLDAHQSLITIIARLSELRVEPAGQKPKASATAVFEDIVISVRLEGVIDFAVEAARLEKELAKLDVEHAKFDAKLGNPAFVEKAPEDVVEKVREQHRSVSEKKEKLFHQLERINAFRTEG
jgi:valyl-tRNA synthetase